MLLSEWSLKSPMPCAKIGNLILNESLSLSQSLFINSSFKSNIDSEPIRVEKGYKKNYYLTKLNHDL